MLTSVSRLSLRKLAGQAGAWAGAREITRKRTRVILGFSVAGFQRPFAPHGRFEALSFFALH